MSRTDRVLELWIRDDVRPGLACGAGVTSQDLDDVTTLLCLDLELSRSRPSVREFVDEWLADGGR